MSVSVTTMLASSCLLLAAVCTATPLGDKKLRNVIITSFGELPYDPLESGYYQGEVLPVNFEDDIKQQTMDVALRTRIQVEDPNEKKTLKEDKSILPEFDEEPSYTNQKVRYDRDYSGYTGAPNIKSGNKKTKISSEYALYTQPQRNLGYALRESRGYNNPTTSTDQSDFNVNTEYYGELGEGWNLRDGEEILQGKNYNILVQTPNSPLPPRETPPPFFTVGRPLPAFYPFPSFGPRPRPYAGFGPYKDSTGYSSAEDDYNSTEGLPRNVNRHDSRTSNTRPKGRAIPYTQFSEDYLRGA